MSHAHSASEARRARVYVVTVSTSRTVDQDRSGPIIRGRLVEAGHEVVDSALIPDDPAAIREILDAALARGDVDAIVYTGGTGISARDLTVITLRARFDREIVGFGELFRMLSFEQVGAAAMLSSAAAGVVRGRLVFALPGSARACDLALDRLILPELGHMLAELVKEAPLPEARLGGARSAPVEEPSFTDPPTPVHVAPPQPVPPPSPRAAVEVAVHAEPGGAAPPTPDPDAAPATGWSAAVAALGGGVVRGAPFDPPAGLPAGAVDVLAAAGDRAVVTLPDASRWIAYGYPSLHHDSAKVLLVREADLVAEVVALHRWPRRVGLCAEDAGLLPGADAIFDAAHARGFAPPSDAETLLAVEPDAIWVTRGRRAARWDGRQYSEDAPRSSVIASLALRWSQR